jgi:hypothetical protein
MEIKNKKYMFALILIILTLVSASIVQAVSLGFRLGISNILNYLNMKMIINYILIFSILFIIVYFWGFSGKDKPSGTILALLIAAIFAISVALTIFITGGQPNFLWEISKLSNVKWLFKLKTIVNASLVAAVCFAIYNYKFKEKAAEKGAGGSLAALFIIIVISIFVASVVNYADEKPTDLPEGVDYDSNINYVDRWLWQYSQATKFRMFFLGAYEGEPGYHRDYHTYLNQNNKLRQGILRGGQNGAGLPAFFLGSLLLLWLFYHYKWFEGNKTLGYGVPIFLAGLLANEPSLTKGVVMSYAWWTALLIIRSSFAKGWGKDKPGVAFGLAFAIVQTVYVAIIGEPYLGIGSVDFLWNFVYGLGLGFVWDMLMGQGGIWEATIARQDMLRQQMGNFVKREGVIKAAKYVLGKAANAALVGVSKLKQLIVRWGYLKPKIKALEAQLKAAIERLEDLIEEEEKEDKRDILKVDDLTKQFQKLIEDMKKTNDEIVKAKKGEKE